MAAPKKHFTYVLQLQPTYRNPENWIDEIGQKLGEHFNYLKELTEKGTMILAGRTDYPVNHTDIFGIAVFEAEDEEAAREIMENDPAIKHQIMSATLHPFSLAMLRQ